MPTSVFINLPVRDPKASIAYYKALGFNHNPDFTDDSAACIVFSDTVYAMVMTHDRFRGFSAKPIPDLREYTPALYALSLDDRAAVDTIAEAALKAGGSEAREVQDMGFMYTRAIADIDGHVWEYFYMDMSKAPTV